MKDRSLLQGRAVLFKGAGLEFESLSAEVPDLLAGEILVKNLYTTLCGSDIHTFCGRRSEPSPLVLGHEVVGEIVSLGPEAPGQDMNRVQIKAGDRITWAIFSAPQGAASPGPEMPQKSTGLFKYGHAQANERDLFSGGLAEYCILKANTAFLKLTDQVPLSVATTINCAHATVKGALRTAGRIEGRRVLVFGAGMLGLSCLAMCREAGASWIGLADSDPGRLNWGRRFGASMTFQTDHGSTAAGFPETDLVFDMTGNPDAMRLGLDTLATGGIAVWIGAVFPASPVAVDAQLVVRRLLQIRGLHNYNYEDFGAATAFIEKHHNGYPFAELIEQEFKPDQVQQAFEYASREKPVRVGIRFNKEE